MTTKGGNLSIEGGFNALFDADCSLDNIGRDGKYGLVLSAVPNRELALKIGVHHDSSHVGDEHVEKTVRRLIPTLTMKISLYLQIQQYHPLRPSESALAFSQDSQ